MRCGETHIRSEEYHKNYSEQWCVVVLIAENNNVSFFFVPTQGFRAFLYFMQGKFLQIVHTLVPAVSMLKIYNYTVLQILEEFCKVVVVVATVVV